MDWQRINRICQRLDRFALVETQTDSSCSATCRIDLDQCDACDRWTAYRTDGVCAFVEISKRDYLAAKRASARQLVSIEDVGVATALLATDYGKLITGETVYVDAGYHIVG